MHDQFERWIVEESNKRFGNRMFLLRVRHEHGQQIQKDWER
jgi:hypothetical protein